MDKKNKPKQLRFRAKNRDIFKAIKDGTKKVETRAATRKFRDIKKGDCLFLVCGKEKIKKRVKRVKIFKTIKDVLGKYRVGEIIPSAKSLADLEKICYSFPDYHKKIKKYGLIAFELE
ncbi:MAG: ASCH domain-containing protein [Parcubacteria group bacterium]